MIPLVWLAIDGHVKSEFAFKFILSSFSRTPSELNLYIIALTLRLPLTYQLHTTSDIEKVILNYDNVNTAGK
jgi:hypothetical protein